MIQGQFNKDSSITSFARSCFQFAVDTKQDLWFSTKDTISKQYDHTFKDIFQEIYDTEYKEKFEALGIEYFYTPHRRRRGPGHPLQGRLHLGLQELRRRRDERHGLHRLRLAGHDDLVLVSPDGNYEYEAAHGTVTRHYYKYLKGEETSTNPVATLFAWSGALRKRGELDGIDALPRFADALRRPPSTPSEAGVMTGDLCAMWEGEVPARKVTSLQFLQEIRARLEAALA